MLLPLLMMRAGPHARRAPQGVTLAVLSQFLKAFGTNYFLRVIPTKCHFSDIFSDMLSGIRILSHICSAILSGILSDISSEILVVEVLRATL